jgi:hypothetical protein
MGMGLSLMSMDDPEIGTHSKRSPLLNRESTQGCNAPRAPRASAAGNR